MPSSFRRGPTAISIFWSAPRAWGAPTLTKWSKQPPASTCGGSGPASRSQAAMVPTNFRRFAKTTRESFYRWRGRTIRTLPPTTIRKYSCASRDITTLVSSCVLPMLHEFRSCSRATANASSRISWLSNHPGKNRLRDRRVGKCRPTSEKGSFRSLPHAHQNNTDHDQRNSSAEFHPLCLPQTVPEFIRRPEDSRFANRIRTGQHAREKSDRIGNSSLLLRSHRDFGLERVNPGHALPDNQRVHIVRPFVGLHRLQIHHVPHDRIVISHAVRSQNVTRQPGAFQSHPNVVAFRHRNMLMLHLARIFQPANLQHEQLRLGNFADHPGELVLYQLVRGDGLVAPLFAQQCILQRAVIACHRRAQRTPRNAVTRLVQAHQRRLQPATLRQKIRFRNVNILQRKSRRHRRPQRPFAVNVVCLESGPVSLHQKAANLVILVFHLRPD